MRIRKTLCILLTVLFLVSITAASASAWNSKKATTDTEPKKAIVEVKEEGPTANCDESGCFVTSFNYGYTSGDADFYKYLSPDVSKKLKDLYGVA
jgi:hypothetical protein